MKQVESERLVTRESEFVNVRGFQIPHKPFCSTRRETIISWVVGC